MTIMIEMKSAHADFEYWLKRDLWSVEELFFLWFEVEPGCPNALFSVCKTHNVDCMEFHNRINGFIDDAHQLDILKPVAKNRYRPRDLLDLMQSKGYEIPEKLRPVLSKPVLEHKKESEIQPTTQGSEVQLTIQESKSKPDASLGKRDKQLKAIMEAVEELGYEPFEIRYGGKAKIKEICEKNRSLFKGKYSFDHAWKTARKHEIVRTKNHENYARVAKPVAPSVSAGMFEACM